MLAFTLSCNDRFGLFSWFQSCQCNALSCSNFPSGGNHNLIKAGVSRSTLVPCGYSRRFSRLPIDSCRIAREDYEWSGIRAEWVIKSCLTGHQLDISLDTHLSQLFNVGNAFIVHSLFHHTCGHRFESRYKCHHRGGHGERFALDPAGSLREFHGHGRVANRGYLEIKVPVWLQNESRSLTEPGSVAVTSRISPAEIFAIAFLVFRIGRGQLRPLVSRVCMFSLMDYLLYKLWATDYKMTGRSNINTKKT